MISEDDYRDWVAPIQLFEDLIDVMEFFEGEDADGIEACLPAFYRGGLPEWVEWMEREIVRIRFEETNLN